MKKMGAKAVVVALAGVLAIGGVVGGTVAWLADMTGPVTNTFTVGNIDITLTEEGAADNAQSFKMIPGATMDKEPKVTVESGSEACYLFVKVEESANFSDFMTCAIAQGWTTLVAPTPGEEIVDGVYYRLVSSLSTDQDFQILDGGTYGQVTVLNTVSKRDMDALTANGGFPTLTFTAYAVQQAGMADVTAAWTAAQNPANY